MTREATSVRGFLLSLRAFLKHRGLLTSLDSEKVERAKNRGEEARGDGRNAANTHEYGVFFGSTSASCTYTWMIVERRRRRRRRRRRSKGKKKIARLVRTRRRTIGNRASRNADVDKGNPYDSLVRLLFTSGSLGLPRWKKGVREISENFPPFLGEIFRGPLSCFHSPCFETASPFNTLRLCDVRTYHQNRSFLYWSSYRSHYSISRIVHIAPSRFSEPVLLSKNVNESQNALSRL